MSEHTQLTPTTELVNPDYKGYRIERHASQDEYEWCAYALDGTSDLEGYGFANELKRAIDEETGGN